MQNNPNWDEKGAREICTIVVNLATIAYMCLYIGVVAAILLRQYSAPEDLQRKTPNSVDSYKPKLVPEVF